MTPAPGQLLKWENQEAQVVWVGKLTILRYGNLEELEAMCLYLIQKARYKTVILVDKKTRWEDQYFYEKERIGRDGM